MASNKDRKSAFVVCGADNKRLGRRFTSLYDASLWMYKIRAGIIPWIRSFVFDKCLYVKDISGKVVHKMTSRYKLGSH